MPHDNATQYKTKKPSKKPQDKLPLVIANRRCFIFVLASQVESFTPFSTLHIMCAGIYKKHKKIYLKKK